jgi:methyl-accepting chemotaxis protein
MQQNAALVEEGAAAAGTLRAQAERLNELVQRFRLR